MTESQKQAYEWAKRMNYQSVAAKYAKTLALLVDELLAAHAKLEPNNPMTLDELREMDGEPVWCVDGKGNECWCLVSIWGDDKEVTCIDSETGGWDEKYYNLPGNGQHGLDINGWLAYRRKPEEEPHE